VSDADGAKRDDKSSRRKAAVIGMLVAGLVVPALGVVVAWKSCGHSAVAGGIDVKGSSLGSWRTTIGRCTSGGLEYRGVELRGRDGKGAARVEIDPIDGPIVRVWSTDGKGPLVVRKQDCTKLAADVRDAGKRDDEAPARYSGAVEAVCALPGGGTLSVDGWWRDCGDGSAD
jgi:hypothetical protein